MLTRQIAIRDVARYKIFFNIISQTGMVLGKKSY
jgi:hypothetical protein